MDNKNRFKLNLTPNRQKTIIDLYWKKISISILLGISIVFIYYLYMNNELIKINDKISKIEDEHKELEDKFDKPNWDFDWNDIVIDGEELQIDISINIMELKDKLDSLKPNYEVNIDNERIKTYNNLNSIEFINSEMLISVQVSVTELELYNQYYSILSEIDWISLITTEEITSQIGVVPTDDYFDNCIGDAGFIPPDQTFCDDLEINGNDVDIFDYYIMPMFLHVR